MHPLYFGESAHQLLGLYHPPVVSRGRPQAVLICGPIGIEYMRAHMTLRILAQRLAAAGFHVMRFDYFATGDSAGDDGQGTVGQWIEDIETAYQELRDMSGVQRVSIVGLRLGATLAVQALERGLRIDQLVLWDPVVRGQSLMQLHEEMQAQALVDDYRFTVPRIQPGDHHELIGFAFPPELRADIREMDLLRVSPQARDGVTIISSFIDEAARQLAAARGWPHVELDDAGSWLELRQLTEVVLPRLIPQTIVDLLSERNGHGV